MTNQSDAPASADRATHEPSPDGLGHSVGIPSAHTPGPWSIVKSKWPLAEYCILDQDGVAIAHTIARQSVGNANARLIAAAPKLLDAAIYAREVLAPHKDDDYAWSAISQLTNAIADAMGAA